MEEHAHHAILLADGAWAAVLLSMAVYYAANFRLWGDLKLVYKWEPEPFGWSMLAGFSAFVLVSLITPAEPRARIERFFDNMRRSTDQEGLPAGQAKPLAKNRGQDLLLLDLTGWLTAERWHGFFRRYREDLVGFVLAWCTVAVLIGGAWALMQVGK